MQIAKLRSRHITLESLMDRSYESTYLLIFQIILMSNKV